MDNSNTNQDVKEQKKYKVVDIDKKGLRNANGKIIGHGIFLSAGLALAYTAFAIAFPKYNGTDQLLSTFLSLFAGSFGVFLSAESIVGIIRNISKKAKLEKKINPYNKSSKTKTKTKSNG